MTEQHTEQEKAEHWLNRQKIYILLRNQRQTWLLSIMVAAMFVYLSHGADDFYLGIVWWLCFSVYLIFRAWATRCFSSLDFEIEDDEAWNQRILVLAMLAGVGWGIGGFLIGADLSPLMRMYVLLILMGVSAASVPLLGVNMRIMLAFQVPALWPYMVWMAYNLGTRDGILLLLIFIFYIVGISKSMRRLEVNLSDSLKMQYEYEHLASS